MSELQQSKHWSGLKMFSQSSFFCLVLFVFTFLVCFQWVVYFYVYAYFIVVTSLVLSHFVCFSLSNSLFFCFFE